MTDLARNPKQIGNLIRRARKQRGWSQTRLGEKAGLRQETISLIETGNPATKLDTILAVLAALDLEFQIGPRSKGQAAAIATGQTQRVPLAKSLPVYVLYWTAFVDPDGTVEFRDDIYGRDRRLAEALAAQAAADHLAETADTRHSG